jgi:hypothetical protein
VRSRAAGRSRGSADFKPSSRFTGRPSSRQAAQLDVLIRQTHGIELNAAVNQALDELELTIRLWVLRISPAIEANRSERESVLEVREKFGAPGGNRTPDPRLRRTPPSVPRCNPLQANRAIDLPFAPSDLRSLDAGL